MTIKGRRLYIKYDVKRTKQLASAIIQEKINDLGKKIETSEFNLYADQNRLWLQSFNKSKSR